MICVGIEVSEGALTRRVQISAPSIERALGIASAGKPGREVRPLFPIDPESFFVPENSDQGEARRRRRWWTHAQEGRRLKDTA